MSRLDDQLAGLATLSPAQLRWEWQRLHKTPAPRISADLLMRGIAWKMQQRVLGGIPPSVARELKRLAEVRPSVANGSDSRSAAISNGRAAAPAPPASAADLRPGTTLMRTWGDRSWTVLIAEDGLVFEGRRFTSLSQIAREITGAHWSGPRFFGLKAARSSAPAGAGAAAAKGTAAILRPAKRGRAPHHA